MLLFQRWLPTKAQTDLHDFTHILRRDIERLPTGVVLLLKPLHLRSKVHLSLEQLSYVLIVALRDLGVEAAPLTKHLLFHLRRDYRSNLSQVLADLAHFLRRDKEKFEIVIQFVAGATCGLCITCRGKV